LSHDVSLYRLFSPPPECGVTFAYAYLPIIIHAAIRLRYAASMRVRQDTMMLDAAAGRWLPPARFYFLPFFTLIFFYALFCCQRFRLSPFRHFFRCHFSPPPCHADTPCYHAAAATADIAMIISSLFYERHIIFAGCFRFFAAD